MTTATAWTPEQLRAIERRDGDLLLDAGAGSGKTSVLVERFVAGVLEDRIAVSSMLAITFTDKAAAELRDRIRARLRELGAIEQARETEGAFISTIHGFCARVLRSDALAAGLDPGFVVLDRVQSEPLAAAAFNDSLSAVAREDPRAVDLIADFGAERLRDAISALYGQLRSRGQSTPRLPEVVAPPIADPRSRLLAAAASVAAELGAIVDPSQRVVEALRSLERCRELVTAGEPWPAELDRLRLGGNGTALSTDACVAYGAALAAYRAAVAAGAAVPVRDQLDALLQRFGERYAQRKRELSGIDFEDLELMTYELLRTRDELRDQYAGRFERIMVDELQDTNRVQLELIELIARGNVFMVGDAQQSIYRFRHADVGLFEERGSRLAQSGARQGLQTNFRSRPEILAVLNIAFGAALGERFRRLVAGRSAAGDGDSRVELLLVDKGAEWELEGLASPWRLAEARALAARVAELVASGTAPGDIVVLMRATTDMRAYERALERHGLPTYVIGGRGYWLHPQVLDMTAYLRSLANPLDEEALYALLASPLVGASIDALVVLGGAARDLDRDPWTVLTQHPNELAQLATADRVVLGDFASWFSDERSKVVRSTVEEMLDHALTRTDYDLAMLAMPGGRRRLANVRKLMRLARVFEREHGPNLRGFVSQIAEREAGRAGDPRESEAPVEGEGLDAIRLMTIHRAKGLEFDTVCVADLGRSPRPPYEIVRVDADGRLGLRLIRAGVGGRVSALDYDAIGQAERLAEEAEERRLFYVAMTRARERLILSGATKFDGWTDGRATGGGPVSWIAPAFVPELGQRIAERGGLVTLDGAVVRLTVEGPSDSVSMPPQPPTAPLPPLLPALDAGPPTALAQRPGPPVSTLSYSALGEYARCGYRFYAERVLRLPQRPGAAASASEAAILIDVGEAWRSATDRGILIHALLERLNFRAPVAPTTEVVAAAAREAGLPPAGDEEAAQLAASVMRFAGSELSARLAASSDLRREQRFAFELCDGLLITGAVDVVARERGGQTLIVDYKSDRLDGADPARAVQSTYATQRLIYALAALRAGAETVEVAHCFLDLPDQPVTARFDRSQLAALETELADLASGILRREFAVSSAPRRALCERCPAEGGLCSWPLELTRRESDDQLF